MWADLLGVSRVDIDQNIFDLGAHSLLIVQAQERLRERGWELTILDVFRHPTIQQLSAHLSGRAEPEDLGLSAMEDRALRQRNARLLRADLSSKA
jgi:aryl carrier-like protein